MRLWAEERKSGTIELFLTLPIRLQRGGGGQISRRLGLCRDRAGADLPVLADRAFLGNPDNGVILASYIGSWLMAGAILAIGAAISAATKNQVIAFVITASLVFVLIAAGTQTVIGIFAGWAPQGLIHAVAAASLFGHFTAITRGVLDLRDLFYFVSIMVAFLAANAVLIDLTKAE